MPVPTSPVSSDEKAHLLLQAVAILRRELSALATLRLENLPELKREKVVLASRLRKLSLPAGSIDAESADWPGLKSQISDLESESRQKMERRLELIGNQILALQDQHQYWRECLNVSFRKFYEPLPAP